KPLSREIFLRTLRVGITIWSAAATSMPPRVDEELKHELRSIVQGSPVEARANEAREQEGPADGEPTPDALITGDRPSATPDALGHDEIETRAELARHIEPSVFPADRPTLIASARRSGAPDDILASLERLPEGP